MRLNKVKFYKSYDCKFFDTEFWLDQESTVGFVRGGRNDTPGGGLRGERRGDSLVKTGVNLRAKRLWEDDGAESTGLPEGAGAATSREKDGRAGVRAVSV